MWVPLPKSLCQKISQDAVANARNQMGSWGWSEKSLDALQPMTNEGMAGIKVNQKYPTGGKPPLMYQERGFGPFLMWWVQGKTLPMGCKQGDGPHFRRGGHVGEPGMVDIPHVGKVWRDQRWRHPGLAPKNFMRDGLSQAVSDNQPTIKAWAQGLFGGGG